MGALRGVAVVSSAAVLVALIFPMASVSASKPTPPAPVSAPAHSAPQQPRLAAASRLTASVNVGNWTWQNPQPQGNPLLAISCPSTATCYAAGELGPILKTIDGGSNWTQQAQAFGIFSLSCASVLVCVGVGYRGAVINTSDGGAHWNSAATNVGNQLNGVSCPTTTVCFAVGSFGSAVTTNDGGNSWTQVTPYGSGDTLNGISCTDNIDCFAAGDNGVIRKIGSGSILPLGSGTTNSLSAISCQAGAVGTALVQCTAVGSSGFTYTFRELGCCNLTSSHSSTFTGAYLYGVSCPTLAQCFAVGADGSVYIQSGSGWGESLTGKPGALYGITCPSPAACLAAGDYGIVMATANGGTGWTQESPGPGVGIALHGVSCPTSSICYAVGNGPTVLGTTDGGVTWIAQPAAHAAVLNQYAFGLSAISCPAPTTCYAVGSIDTIIQTTDSGAQWTAESNNFVGDFSSVSCPSVSECFAVGVSNGQFSAIATTDSGANWNFLAMPSVPNPSIPDAISCPSTTVCFIAGSSILSTTDAGAHWTSHSSNSLNSVSCPSMSTCFAVGASTIQATVNGGASWTDQTPAGTTDTFYSVSCPSTMSCFAVGSNGKVVGTSDGATWKSQTSATVNFLYGVSCSNTLTCIAVGLAGVISGTADGGATKWRFLGPSGTANDLSAVSCPTTTTCFAVEATSGGIFNTSNGKTWFQSLLSNVPFHAISCPSATVCFAVAQFLIYSTIDGGQTWRSKSITQSFTGISCTTASTCLAVDGEGTALRTVDGGTNWTASTLVTSSGLAAVSCATASVCSAVDLAGPGRVFTTADGGGTWTLSFNLASDAQAGSTGAFDAISCPTTTSCFAAGPGGLMATTSVGGGHWRTDNLPSTTTITGVSCASASTCVATGADSTLFRTADSGGSWEIQFGAVVAAFRGVSCPGVASCFAVGGGGAIAATTNGGAAWVQQQPVGTTNPVVKMSCPSSSFCYASALDAILVTHDGGSSWIAHPLSTTDQVLGISCPGLNTCYAVGWPGAIYFTGDGGTTWTYQPSSISGADLSLDGISCSSLTSCVAVGVSGTVLATTNGTTWSTESSSTTQNLNAVSCPSISSCVAVGANGVALTRSGGSWHANPSGTANLLADVSCANVNICYAAGAAGTVLASSNGGVSWTGRSPGTARNLYGIGCVSTTMCLAVGAQGTVVVTQDGLCWTDHSAPTFNTLFGVAAPDMNHAWVTGAGGTILENSNLFPRIQPTVTGVSPTAGPPFGGTSVTISGTAFSSGICSVHFGNTPAASFSLLNDTTATVVSPTHAAGTVDVTVTTAVGTSSVSAADRFQFLSQNVYTAVTPVRLLDTRNSGPRLGDRGSLNLAIGGVSVPANATAVVLNVTAVNESTAGFFTVFPTGAPLPLASNLNWVAGETVPILVTVGLGTAGSVTIYNGIGSADAVVDLEGYFSQSTGGSAGEFVPVVPARIADTRLGIYACPRPILCYSGLTPGPGATLDVQVTGVGGIPASGVTAVVMNVTATHTTTDGYFTVFPTGAPLPLASNLNWKAGVTVPNRVVVPVGAGGFVSFYNGSQPHPIGPGFIAGGADLIVDVNGYFTDATGTGTSFVPLTPARIADTRYGTGGFNSPLGPAASMTLMVAGYGGVPAMTSATPPQAVVLSVTVEGATMDSDLVVWPDDGLGPPLASDLNFVRGQTVPNLVIVQLSPAGKIDIFNGQGSTSVIVDVVGWFG